MKLVLFLFVVIVALDKEVLSAQIEERVEENEELPNENEELKSVLAEYRETNEEQKKKITQLENEIDDLKKPHKSCADLLRAGRNTSGVYSIDPDCQGAFEVYCDQHTREGGFVTIQRRKRGFVDFYRGWDDYKNGFGNFSGPEFWLGLDNIHRLTSQPEKNELLVRVADWDDNIRQALYKGFAVAGEDDNYQMTFDSFAGGTAGDSFSYHKGMQFSTKDRDNDQQSAYNCAERYKGAWWYNACHESNLNGLFQKGGNSPNADGIIWNSWQGSQYSAMRSAMGIRPQ